MLFKSYPDQVQKYKRCPDDFIMDRRPVQLDSPGSLAPAVYVDNAGVVGSDEQQVMVRRDTISFTAPPQYKPGTIKLGIRRLKDGYSTSSLPSFAFVAKRVPQS